MNFHIWPNWINATGKNKLYEMATGKPNKNHTVGKSYIDNFNPFILTYNEEMAHYQPQVPIPPLNGPTILDVIQPP